LASAWLSQCANKSSEFLASVGGVPFDGRHSVQLCLTLSAPSFGFCLIKE
jgi:hypothetical protein